MNKHRYKFGPEYNQNQQIHLAKIYRRKLEAYTKQAENGKLTLQTISQKLNKTSL